MTLTDNHKLQQTAKAERRKKFKRIAVIAGCLPLVVYICYLLFFFPRPGPEPRYSIQNQQNFYDKQIKDHTGRNCRTVEIQGCQYLEFETAVGYWGITHKGNCTNPIHYQSQKP